MKKTDLVLTLGQRLILLLCVFLVGYVLTVLSSYVLGRLMAGNTSGAHIYTPGNSHSHLRHSQTRRVACPPAQAAAHGNCSGMPTPARIHTGSGGCHLLELQPLTAGINV